MSPIETASADAALGEEFLVEVLSDLVRTKSVNPGIYEVEIAERVAAWLEPTPAEVSIVEFAPGRPSVAAVMGDGGDGPTLVLNGHIDTVPIDTEGDPWTSDPFEPAIRDGYLYGRGSCDMKSGLTTQIAVAHHLASLDKPLRGRLVLHFASGEECGEPGTQSLLDAGFTGDYGIVTEPTQARVGVATRGLVQFRIVLHGRSIHASRAHLGVNPVRHLRLVLEALEDYEREVTQREHPLLPGGTCTPTVVHGGIKENAVAERCELLVDRRLIPGETVEGELADIRARLEALVEIDPTISVEVSAMNRAPFGPAEISPDSPFAARVSHWCEELTPRSGEVIGTPFASDIDRLINNAGIEALQFGPGNVAECHCVDERVALAELYDVAKVIAAVSREMLL
jgi:succinyl-diaminopimelate desuccinylase